MCNVLVESFFACFRQFDFFTQTDHFAKAIAFALWPFFQFSKPSHFSNNKSFLEPFFPYNVWNVVVERFFAYFRQFCFLTQTDHFAKAIAFALWPFFQFSKSSHFSNNKCFLEPFFA